MGRMSEEAVELENVDALINYLMRSHSVYLQYKETTYYLTDANDIYWRAQDTNTLNDKGHYIDCSELIASVREFVELPFIEGVSGTHSISDVFDKATFYPSIKVPGVGSPDPTA